MVEIAANVSSIKAFFQHFWTDVSVTCLEDVKSKLSIRFVKFCFDIFSFKVSEKIHKGRKFAYLVSER